MNTKRLQSRGGGEAGAEDYFVLRKRYIEPGCALLVNNNLRTDRPKGRDQVNSSLRKAVREESGIEMLQHFKNEIHH